MSTRTGRCRRPLGLGICLWGLSLGTAVAQEPLPEKVAFLEEVRRNLRSNRQLLSLYTFTQERETRFLNKKGEVKRTERKIWEVFPGGEDTETFRRLVSKDGQPVSQSKLEKQDKRWERKRQRTDTEKGRKRLAEEDRKEEEAVAEAFRLFRFELEEREIIDGYPTIRVRFEPRPEYRPRLKEVRQMKKMRGVAWIHEPDYQLVRIEVELLEPIAFGWGILAKLRKGARLQFSRQLVNDEIWLPSQSRVIAAFRFLFKGIRLESIDRYSNFQKFIVETAVHFDPQ